MARYVKVLSQLDHGLVLASAIVVSAFCLLAVAPARAESPEIVLRYGEADSHYERSGIGLRFGPLWSADWGNWKATLRPELELSHFRYTGSAAGPDSLDQGGGIGLFRIQYGEGRFRPYGEAGLGVALFSRDKLGTKQFSTHFQFSEHLGLGLLFAERWFAGWQYSHFSNGDIDKPNDGIDMHQVVVGAHF